MPEILRLCLFKADYVRLVCNHSKGLHQGDAGPKVLSQLPDQQHHTTVDIDDTHGWAHRQPLCNLAASRSLDFSLQEAPAWSTVFCQWCASEQLSQLSRAGEVMQQATAWTWE